MERWLETQTSAELHNLVGSFIDYILFIRNDFRNGTLNVGHYIKSGT